MDATDKIIKLRNQIFEIQYKSWTQDTLFTLKWCIILTIAVASWVTWWILLDKKRFKEIALAGLITGILTFLLNTMGVEMTLWAYPTQIFGLVRTWSLLELSLMMTSYMLLYQYFNEWKKYIVALSIYGVISSFIAQPLFVHFGLYRLKDWNYFYSFLVFIFIGIVVKFVTKKIITIEKHSLERTK